MARMIKCFIVFLGFLCLQGLIIFLRLVNAHGLLLLDGDAPITNKLERNSDGYEAKYIKLLEDQLQFLKESVQENLNDVRVNVIAGRATTRAFGQYQVMKDAKNDPKVLAKLM